MPEWKSRPSDDPVLGGLAGNPAIPDELLARLIREHGPVLTWALGRVRPLPEAALAAMLGHPDYWVRVAVVENTSVDPGVVLGMADDAHPVVLGRISARPDVTLPEEYLPRLLERLEWYVDTGLMTRNEMFGEMDDRVRRDRRLLGVLARHPREDFRLAACRYGGRLDEADRQALAADPSPAVRAARTEALAEETRTLTTADLDGVNARGRRAAPPHLLFPAYLEQKECGRKRLRRRRGFPTAGLARFAGDADPGLRVLAVLDPQAGPEVLAALLTDPDAEVRGQAARCPRLPVDRIVALLGDPELGRAAAANPALPVGAMQRLISRGPAGSAPG